MAGNNPGVPVNFRPQGVHPVQVFPAQAVLTGQVHPVPGQTTLHAAQALPLQAHAVQHVQQHPVQQHTVQQHPVQQHPIQKQHQPEVHSTQQTQNQNITFTNSPAAAQQPVATQQQTPAQNPPHPPTSSQPQQQPQFDTDPLIKYQHLLPILKESVVNLIKNTVSILQNISNGTCKQNEMQQLNKCMEDFYNISDQVHHWLVLADTTVGHYLMGTCFSTEVTSFFNTQQIQAEGEAKKDILFYSQFLLNAKRHVAASSKLRDMLTDFADDLGNG